MTNDLLIGFAFALTAGAVTAYVMYLEYRRDQRRSKAPTKRGGKHTYSINTTTIKREAPVQTELPLRTFPNQRRYRPKSVEEFYHRICGGWDVMEQVCKQYGWYYCRTDKSSLVISDKRSRHGKANYASTRAMSFASERARANGLAKLIDIHKAEAAKRGVTPQIWERKQ